MRSWREDGVFRLTIEMPLSVHRKVATEAERRGISKGQMLRLCIERGMALIEREREEAPLERPT